MNEKEKLLTKDNVDEVADQAIDKYWKKGLIIDAIFWSRVIALMRDKIKEGKPKRMLR